MRVDETRTPDGQLVERLVHHGDGTGTRTTYDPNGQILDEVATEGLPIIGPIDPLGQLVEAVGAEGVIRSALLGAHLAGRAGDLWDALEAISLANTARPAIEVVTDAALTAATTPLENP